MENGPSYWSYKDAPIYANWWKQCKDHLKEAGRTVRRGWAGADRSQEQFTKDIRKALHTRITLKGGEPMLSRKWQNDYQVAIIRDRDRLLQIANRFRVYQFETAEMRLRFGHLLSSHGD